MRFLVLFFFILLTALRGTAETPSLQDVDALTGRWIALRTTLAEEKREWQERKSAWEEEISLLEDESEALKTEIESGQDLLSSAEEQRASLLAESEKTKTELEELNAVLSRSRVEIEQLLERIPDSLLSQLPALDGDGGSTRDAQRLVAVLSAIESLHQNIHNVREVISVEGQAREVDVLYIGLAQGFAVSQQNEWAAMGSPGTDGWTWTTDKINPLQVRALLNIHQQRETATLISMPLSLEDSP